MTDGLGRFLLKMRVWRFGVAVFLCAGATLWAQGGAESSGDALPSAPMPAAGLLTGPYAVQRATPGELALSLDDAIARGLEKNLNVQLAKQNELTVHGQILAVGSALLPNMSFE